METGYIRILKGNTHDSTIYKYISDALEQGADYGLIRVDIEQLIALDNWFINAVSLDRFNFIVRPEKFAHKESPHIPFVEKIKPLCEYVNKRTITHLN